MTKPSYSFEKVEREGEPVLVVTVHDEGPTVELTLRRPERRGDDPTVLAVTVRKTTGVCSRDLRIPVATHVGTVADALAGWRALEGDTSWTEARERRELTDDFLTGVLTAYETAPRGKRIAAVREQFGGPSEQTVYRWLREARARGKGGD